MLDLGVCAQLACLWEASARKVGNVHRFRDFADLTYVDFLNSAATVAAVIQQAPGQGVGATVLAGVQATRQVVATNTNLGILLLFAPLAAVPREEDLGPGVERVLASLDIEDARLVYEAIRLANPGGLGVAPEQDVRQQPTIGLREVMRLAADRDLIARQYANGFQEVLAEGLPAWQQGLNATGSLEGAIRFLHLHLLAKHRDSLIVRKRGQAKGEEVRCRARDVWESGWPGTRAGWRALAELDGWLCERELNPGTTADLVAGCLFVLLRQDTITLPSRIPWSADIPSS
jgi:triphosphoribosyl-dephospho-CoA synthase